MATALNSEKWMVVEFYPYASMVTNTICEYDFNDEKHTFANKKLVPFFHKLLGEAEHITGKILVDNKVAMMIRDKESATSMYIGLKDGKYSLGLGLFQEYPQKSIQINQ